MPSKVYDYPNACMPHETSRHKAYKVVLRQACYHNGKFSHNTERSLVYSGLRSELEMTIEPMLRVAQKIMVRDGFELDVRAEYIASIYKGYWLRFTENSFVFEEEEK